jgi:hypothetical protein
MNHTVTAVLGITAAALQFIAMAPYFMDIVRGRTKPERATWWIWLLLNAVAVGAQIGAGATWSLLMSIAQLLVTGAVAVCSLKYGYGQFHKKDAAAMVVAVFGVFLWWLLDSPLAALIIVLLVDVVGYWLTLEKTWRAPHTETFATWAIGAVSGLMSAVAAGHWNLTHILYPLYIGLGNGLMAVVIMARRPVVDAKSVKK